MERDPAPATSVGSQHAEYVASSMQKMDDPYAVGRAVQKAIGDSTNATNGDVAAFFRSLREQGYVVRLIDGPAGSVEPLPVTDEAPGPAAQRRGS